MKAIILAAGMGTRLGKYTKNVPKGMLIFNGKSLIEQQIDVFNKFGITEIYIITGYKSETIQFPNVKYFHNPNYSTTNMIESLMTAKEILSGDVIISYSDIIYNQTLFRHFLDSKDEIGVTVDMNWKNYWNFRYGTTEYDIESLEVSNGYIINLGQEVISSENLLYRYIGLLKFNNNGIKKLLDIYNKKKISNENWSQSGKSFKNGYMTDILNELIQSGNKIKPIIINSGWLEFDTNLDYETYNKLLLKGKLDKIFKDEL